MANKEQRFHATEIRVSLDGSGEANGNKLVGYSAKFNVESEILYDRSVCPGPFVEVIAPGAFKRTLKDSPDVRALYNHDTSAVLGRTKSGTLELVEDSTGLAFSVELPNTAAGRDARELVKRGDIDGCSFGFCVVEDDLVERPGKPALRTLIDVDLFEITPACAFPAYASTEVKVRHRTGKKSTPRLDHSRMLFDLNK